MSHPRALNEQQAIDAEAWYQEYERVGTLAAKCKELGITPHTFMDTIKRVRKQDTRLTREKLSAADIDALANEVLAATNSQG